MIKVENLCKSFRTEDVETIAFLKSATIIQYTIKGRFMSR